MIRQHIGTRPLKLAAWQQALPPGYHDREFILYVVEHGLSVLGPEPCVAPAQCVNYKSTQEHAALVEKQLSAELAAGQLIRQPAGAVSHHIHALGAIPKSAEEVRIIHDLSSPAGQSINDRITYLHCPWASLDDALRLVTRGCWMARVDIKQYYRPIPVDPADWPLMAFRWQFAGEAEPATLWDPYLEFGQRNAPEVAHRFTQAILAILRSRGHKNVIGIMDDFLVVDSTQEGCEATWQALLGLLQELGFQPNRKPGKTDPPAQVVKFVGVLIDSIQMEVRLCPEKLANISARLADISSGHKVKQRDLESLAGLLAWACKVVYGGRTFMRRIWDALATAQAPHHHVRLQAEARADLQWWAENLPQFNGKATILPAEATAPMEFQTDAESTGAVGVFIMGGYAGLTHPQLCSLFLPEGAYVPPPGQHISVYETFAVLAAVRLFPAQFENRHLRVRSDNTQTVAAIQNQTSSAGQTKAHIMRILRELFAWSVKLNFRLTAAHLPGFQNAMADALSRGQHDRFTGLLARWKEQALT